MRCGSSPRATATMVHHLDRDPEFLIELPERIEIHRILVRRHNGCAEVAWDGAQPPLFCDHAL